MINVAKISQSVQKAINALPSQINLKRILKNDDGYGGYIESETDVKTFNSFIDFSSNKPQINISTNDSGVITSVKNITLLAAFDSNFTIEKDDFFTFKGVKYKVTYPINQFDIYWECELEVV